MNIKELEALATDPRFIRLSDDMAHIDFLTIIDEKRRETTHSAFITWLLDCSSNHNLRSYPLERLFRLYAYKQEHFADAEKISDMELFTLNKYENIKVLKEKSVEADGKKGRIDIFITCDAFDITIENKIDSNEHDDQTMLYYNSISKSSPQKKHYFIFLSLNSSLNISAGTRYIPITYEEFFDWIIEKCLDNPMINDESHAIIRQYSENLGRQGMARINKKLCTDIYNYYKSTIDMP